MKTIHGTDTLRKRLVLSFFILFTFFLCFSIFCTLFLLHANIVTMDQSQTISDLRLVSMFMDMQTPLGWSVRDDSLFKGDIRISGNPKITAGLAVYIRPDTRLSFHVGEIPKNVVSFDFNGIDPVMRLVLSLKKNDPRLNPQFHGDGLPPPPKPDIQTQGTDETYILAGGLLHAIKSASGKNIGWIQLERESLGQGLMEDWAFRIFLAVALVFATFIHFIAYRIIFKLSEPVHRLVTMHNEVTVAKENLEDISRRDPLTGLLNRRGFDASLNESVFFSDGKGSAVALIDLDNFKKINDTYGHGCGDYVLKEVSRIISSGIRQGDIACRWGGEEFLVCYSGAEDDLLSEITERIRHSIANYPYSFNEHTITVTVTIGFSPCKATSDFTTCVSRADAALYRGKKEGKNRVVRN